MTIHPKHEQGELKDLDPVELRNRVSLKLIELIYDAAVDPRRWQLFLETLSGACGGAATAMILSAGEPAMKSYAYRHEMDPDLSATINRLAVKGFPWAAPAEEELRFVLGSDFFPVERMPETAMYREWMQPQGLAPEPPITHRISTTEPRSGLAIYAREGDRSLTHDDAELCDTLVPHMRRAYDIHCRVHGARQQRRALSEVVDRFPMGVMLLDSDGNCVSVNASARRIVELDDGVRLEEEQLVLDDQQRHQRLLDAIAHSAAEAARGTEPGLRVIAVTRPSGGAAFSVAVSPLFEKQGETRPQDAATVVFIADANVGAMSLAGLQELYSLTPAEAALVGELVTGRSLDEVAERCGIRTTTARGYLKTVFQKTGTNSQRALVHLVLTGVFPLAESPPGES